MSVLVIMLGSFRTCSEGGGWGEKGMFDEEIV